MGWLLGCFTCSGKLSPKASHLHRDRTKAISSGRPSSAAVAHATSPEDLYKVRSLSSDFASAVSNGYNGRGLFESQAQTKRLEVEKTSPKRNDASKTDRAHTHGSQENGEPESLRTKLMQEADAAKKLSDEIKYLKACQSLLESPSGSFRVIFDSLDESSSGQVDYGEHAWLISSVITPIQPRSPLIEAHSSASKSPLDCLKEGFLLHNSPKNGGIDDTIQGSNALKCAELSLFTVTSGACDDESEEGFDGSFPSTRLKKEGKPQAIHTRVNIPSPPWPFSEAKLDPPTQIREEVKAHAISSRLNVPSPPWPFTKLDTPTRTFASSEDLLQEHLDFSSLIEDSALITNWELSLGKQSVEQDLAHGHLVNPSCEGSAEGEWEAELHSSTQHGQGHVKHLHSFGPLEDGLRERVEVPLLEGMVSCTDDQAHHSPKFLPTGAGAQPDAICAREQMHIEEDMNTNADVETELFEAEFYDGDSESATQGSQFRPSKRLWSSTSKGTFEREPSIPLVAGYGLHDNNSDVHEVLLSRMHSQMQAVQEAESGYGHDPCLAGQEHAIEPEAMDPILPPQQPWSTCSPETSPVETSEERDALPKIDEAHSLGFDLVNISEQGEALARRYESLHLATSPVGDQQETQRNRSRQSPCENIMLDQQMAGKVEQEHPAAEDEEVRLLDSTCEGSHKSFPEAKANPSGDDVGFNIMETSTLSWPSNESASNQNSDASPASSPPSDMQTPSRSNKSYRYSPKLDDDRPILGTVAAHWSPMSTTTRKWWDGKGILNSTNKYKEDQKVNWHAVPFEVRLEQALAKQDSIVSK